MLALLCVTVQSSNLELPWDQGSELAVGTYLQGFPVIVTELQVLRSYSG
jgi:hypothetical protein